VEYVLIGLPCAVAGHTYCFLENLRHPDLWMETRIVKPQLPGVDGLVLLMIEAAAEKR
jgi:hypothetical protein